MKRLVMFVLALSLGALACSKNKTESNMGGDHKTPESAPASSAASSAAPTP